MLIFSLSYYFLEFVLQEIYFLPTLLMEIGQVMETRIHSTSV